VEAHGDLVEIQRSK
jgi:hypothetical protein